MNQHPPGIATTVAVALPDWVPGAEAAAVMRRCREGNGLLYNG